MCSFIPLEGVFVINSASSPTGIATTSGRPVASVLHLQQSFSLKMEAVSLSKLRSSVSQLCCKALDHSTNIHLRHSEFLIKITKTDSVEFISRTEGAVASETSCISSIPRIIDHIGQFWSYNNISPWPYVSRGSKIHIKFGIVGGMNVAGSKLVVVYSTEKLVPMSQTARCHNSEYRSADLRRCKNIKPP